MVLDTFSISLQRLAPLCLAILALTLVPACSETTEPSPTTETADLETAPSGTVSSESAESAETAALSAERMRQWSRNCVLCHVRGEGGAPVLGDRAAWAARWEQGEAELLKHTVEGLNNMPPLGYCMDCEREDFLALIRFMGGRR